MEVMALLPADFERLQEMRKNLRDMTRAMTWPERRSFTDEMAMILERAECIDTQGQ